MKNQEGFSNDPGGKHDKADAPAGHGFSCMSVLHHFAPIPPNRQVLVLLLHSCLLQTRLDAQRDADNPSEKVVSQDLFCCGSHPQHGFAEAHKIQIPLRCESSAPHDELGASISSELQGPPEHPGWQDDIHSTAEEVLPVLPEGHTVWQ